MQAIGLHHHGSFRILWQLLDPAVFRVEIGHDLKWFYPMILPGSLVCRHTQRLQNTYTILYPF